MSNEVKRTIAATVQHSNETQNEPPASCRTPRTPGAVPSKRRRVRPIATGTADEHDGIGTLPPIERRPGGDRSSSSAPPVVAATAARRSALRVRAQRADRRVRRIRNAGPERRIDDGRGRRRRAAVRRFGQAAEPGAGRPVRRGRVSDLRGGGGGRGGGRTADDRSTGGSSPSGRRTPSAHVWSDRIGRCPSPRPTSRCGCPGPPTRPARRSGR